MYLPEEMKELPVKGIRLKQNGNLSIGTSKLIYSQRLSNTVVTMV